MSYRGDCFLLLLILAVAFLLTACGEAGENFEEILEGDGVKLLAIGDSQFDTNLDSGESIPDFVSEKLGVPVVNESSGGSVIVSDNGEDILAQYIRGDWDVLIMDGGGNDLNDECGCGECSAVLNDVISEDGQFGALPTFAEVRMEDGVKVIFMAYYDVPPTAQYGFDRCEDVMREYEARLAKLAAGNDNFWLVDASDVVSPDNLDFYLDDHVHPSPLGAEVISELIVDKILEILDLEE